MFSELVSQVFEFAKYDFITATAKITETINVTNDFTDILMQIGTIPESIPHDSTEEKLFAKASDAVLARAFRELGLKSTVINARADVADVIAESQFHNYTMVADAKAFRMSRTAKNQKDYKVTSLSGWRKDSNYAVLCAPYYQYPRTQSQIYAQSIENNVCLLSWEHVVFLLRNNIKESANVNLTAIWNFGAEYAKSIVVSKSKNCFFAEYNKTMLEAFGFTVAMLDDSLKEQAKHMKNRGVTELKYWEAQVAHIRTYTRERAIEELLKEKKIFSKIKQIESFIAGISHD